MKISKFKDKLDNTPHLMTPQTFVSTASFLTSLDTDFKMDCGYEDDCCEDERCNFNSDTGVGTIYVSGSLTYQTEWYQWYYGGTSYESIREQAELLSEKNMNTLVIIGDSGGGEAYNMFETASYLRYLADTNNFKILWYVDGISASAAYGLACTADEIIANPMAEVGSIGVVVRLRNISKALKQAGVEDTYIYYGNEKIPYDKSGNWNKDFIDRIQASVDSLGDEFTSFVADHRNIPVEDVRSTQAAVYSAKDALEVGLIDSVMTHEEFYTYLADYVQNETTPEMFKTNRKLTSEQEKVEMKELEEAQAELSAFKVKMDAEVAAKAALEAEVVTMKASLEDTKKQLASFVEAAAKLEADKEALVKAQADAAIAKRKEQLSAVLPADQVEEKLTVLADSSDAVFAMALSGYEAAEKAKLNSPLFKEAGGEGAPVPEVDPVKAQAEYNKKRYNK